MPNYLKRHLTLKEMYVRQELAENTGKKFVVWKHGRTTHTTYGIASEIDSNYQSPEGVVSREFMIKDHHGAFSDKGDSGSWIWDMEGYVWGMLWGGKKETFVSYATPMEVVLDDIKLHLQVSNIELVVRDEDRSGRVFVRGEGGGLSIEVASHSAGPQVPSLFDDGDTEFEL
jgi:hypothetical protein